MVRRRYRLARAPLEIRQSSSLSKMRYPITPVNLEFLCHTKHGMMLRAVVRGVWGHAPPRKKNNAIFNHFHDKKFFQKNINIQDYYHCPFYNAAPPLIYLNINIMDTYSI